MADSEPQAQAKPPTPEIRRRGTRRMDLVLAGGGVKGVGLVGAVVKLLETGYRPQRISGTSAGSIVGAILAAAAKSNRMGPPDIRDLVLSLDYRKLLDPGPIKRVPLLGAAWAILRGDGVYRGDYIRDFVAAQLRDLGVETFGDLRIDDPQLPEERRYRLVCTATDITRGQLVRLPWDYRGVYGLNPDEQPVADAVRASMSIPFLFRTVTLTSTAGLRSTLVDGGLLSNFPIDSLDRTDRRRRRWPTFGVTLLPNLPEGNYMVIPGLAPLRAFGGPHLLEEVITAILVGRDQAYLNQPSVSARTIRVDAGDIGVLDFGIGPEEVGQLYRKGYDAATEFLMTWDHDAYRRLFP